MAGTGWGRLRVGKASETVDGLLDCGGASVLVSPISATLAN